MLAPFFLSPFVIAPVFRLHLQALWTNSARKPTASASISSLIKAPRVAVACSISARRLLGALVLVSSSPVINLTLSIKMPPMPVGQGQPVGQTTMQKLTMGATMGGTVGLILGFLYGSYHIIRFGPGPNGMLRTIGQYMAGSGATFGFFMAIGHTIRTDSTRAGYQRFTNAKLRPHILPANFQYAKQSSSRKS